MPRYYRPSLWPAYRKLLQHSKAPILVGPWRGELGYEALYWLPWLAQFCEDAKIAPERLIPISRGGMAALYGTPHGIELHAMRTVQDIRIENHLQRQKTGLIKQTGVRAFDKAIYRDVATTLGLKRYHTLHPAWMFQGMDPFISGQKGLAWARPRLKFGVVPPMALPESLVLPKPFVAVRFYARATFPMNEMTAQFCSAVITQIARNVPVILITSDLHIDDHVDFEPRVLPPNVFKLADLVQMTPENNVAIQSAVLSHAVGFVGTYGGFANIAQRFAKPCATFFTDWHSTCVANKHLSQWISHEMGVPFHVLRLGDLPLLQSIMPQMTVHEPRALVPVEDLTPQPIGAHS